MEQQAAEAGTGDVDPQPSEVSATQASAIEQSKTFVADVRSFALTTQEEDENPASAFAEELDLASTLAEQPAESMIESMGLAADQVAALYDSGAAGPVIIDSTDDAGVAKQATVTMGAADAQGNVVITVLGDIRNETFDLRFSVPLDTEQGDLDATATGSVRSSGADGLALSIPQQGIAAHLERVTEGGVEYMDAATFSGNVTLMQFGVDNPVSATGSWSAEALRCTGCENEGAGSGNEDPETGAEYNPRRFDFTGTLADTGNRLEATVSVSVPETVARNYDWDEAAGDGNPVSAQLTVAFEAQLAGKQASVSLAAEVLSASWDPNADDSPVVVDGSVSLRVETAVSGIIVAQAVPRYTDDALTAVEVVVTNTNDQTIRIVFPVDEEDQVLDGQVFVGTTQIGTIDTTDSGVVLIRYVDGTFESIV